MLLSLPVELLSRIQYYIDKSGLLELCLTSRYSYNKTLPILYAHLELGYHTHVRHLQASTNVNLRRALTHHTKRLTLKSRQNGSYWRAYDLIELLGTHSPIDTLTFYDFQMITTQNIHEIVAAFPSLKHLEFNYCHIVDKDRHRHISIYQNNTNKNEFLGVTTLSLLWTDFTAAAIQGISSFSKITTLYLGSNHNKYDGVNDDLIRSLHTHCPHIRNLTISMPRVEEYTLSETVCLYGNQLKHLSLRCDSPMLLQAIANHCHQLEHLELRGTSGNGNPSHEPFLNMIRGCQSLSTLDLRSFAIQDIPTVFWERLLHINSTKQKAMDALEYMRTLQKQEEVDSNSTVQHSRRREFSRIYHYAITEELLAQRHYYNQNNGEPEIRKTDLRLSFPFTLI